MLKNFKNTISKPIYLGMLLLVILLLLSYILRKNDFEKVTGAPNLQATYHVLLTITALNEGRSENNFYLPTVSLGMESDKNIPWGLTVPTKSGDYIYTSFTPVGFLAPYLWFKAFNLEPSVNNLAEFNFFLGCLSASILFLLLVSLLRFNGYDSWGSVFGALVGVAIGIFSREALQSFGIVYWSHSLYQPILISSILFLFKYLTSEIEDKRRTYAYIIAFTAFIGAMTEWTGYVFNAGMIFLLIIKNRSFSYAKVLAILIAIGTATAGIITVFHYSIAVGFEPAISSFLGRFLGRNITKGSLVNLIQGYSLSYGFFILTIFTTITLAYFGNRQQATGNRQQVTFFIFAVAFIPLLENVLMMQHATKFSFDRLKFILPASLILAFSFVWLEVKSRFIFLGFIFLSCLHGYSSYKEDTISYSSWDYFDVNNRKIASKISDAVDTRCAVFLSNTQVRGYANMLFHRSIFENKSYQDSADLLVSKKACASVYLEGKNIFADLPKYTKAIIRKIDSSTEIIINTEEYDDEFFLTDSQWVRGIARRWAGFFVPSTTKFVNEYKVGRLVILADGEIREIKRAEVLGGYLNIYLSGELLNPEKVGLPSKFFVEDKTRAIQMESRQ